MNGENDKRREFEGFSLDVEKKILWRSGEIVPLPPKAVEMLIVLIKNRGEVVSKNELLEAVWGETFVEESVLSNNVYLLRKTLNDLAGAKNLIQTVPRRGYRFGSKELEKDSEFVLEHHVFEQTLIEEIPAEKIEKTIESAQPLALPSAPKRFPARLVFAALTLVLLTGGFAFWYWNDRAETSIVKTQIESIAVLPLENLIGGGEEDKSLAIGLTDALIMQLGKSEKIVVRPLSSVMRIASKEPDAIAAGKTLTVDAVIVWSLQKTGNRLRITARLLRVADGKQLWNEVFEENENDIFKIQDAVSNRAANSLTANLKSREIQKISERGTDNNQAYEAYLRGRYHWNKRDFEGFSKAQSFFEQAATLDAKFAEAQAGLADVHLGFYDYGYKKAEDSIPLALNAVNNALKLNPTLADAYSTVGSIEFLHNKNWLKTEENFKKAIELAPNDPTPHLRYGWMLSVTGKFEEGLRELKTAEKLDPTSRIGQTNIAYNLLVSKRLAEAEAKLIEIVRLEPDFSLPYWYLGTLYFEQGKRQESLDQYLKAFEIDEGDSELVSRIKKLRASENETKLLKTWRETLEKRYTEKYFPPTNVALVAALEKNREKTLFWLKEAEKVKDPWLLQIVYDGEYRFLQNDAEFQSILNKINFQ